MRQWDRVSNMSSDMSPTSVRQVDCVGDKSDMSDRQVDCVSDMSVRQVDY